MNTNCHIIILIKYTLIKLLFKIEIKTIDKLDTFIYKILSENGKFEHLEIYRIPRKVNCNYLTILLNMCD